MTDKFLNDFFNYIESKNKEIKFDLDKLDLKNKKYYEVKIGDF